MTKRLRVVIVPIALLLLIVSNACEQDNEFRTDLALSNETIIIPKDRFSSKVVVYSDTDWKVEVENPESDDWLSLSPEERITSVTGSGRNYFEFTAQENLSGDFREGSFIITTQSSRKTLVIRQNR